MSPESWIGCLAMVIAITLIAHGVGGVGARRARARQQAAQADRNKIMGMNSRVIMLLDEIGMSSNNFEKEILWCEVRKLDYEMETAAIKLHLEHGQTLDLWNHNLNLYEAAAAQQHAWEQMQKPCGKDMRYREGMI